MPKDYQEIERIVEECLQHSPLKAFFEDNLYQSTDVYADTKERITKALTTYGNARELIGIEKVEKFVKNQLITDPDTKDHPLNELRNEETQATLDHIERVKKELK